MPIYNDEVKVDRSLLNRELKLAEAFFDANPHTIRYCSDKRLFYKYDNGYHQTINDVALERFFVLNAYGDHEPINRLTVNGLKNFIRRYAQLSDIPAYNFNQGNLLNLANGILDVASGEFRGHTPEIYSTIRIPYAYTPDATCENWLRFINSSLEGDVSRITVLQEFMGYCLGVDNQFQKALFLLGEPGAGKGTLIKVVEQLVGSENCAALPLGAMNDEQSLGNIVDKLINIDADVSISAKGFEADFRRITAGDKITAKLLYKDKFSFRPYCKLILAANELPHISDKTRAFFRRMIVIPFNVTFEGREDRLLDHKLRAEISGILNWALEGRKRLYANNGFTMGQDLIGYVDEIKRLNNPVELYFYEYIGFHDDIHTLKSEMYKHYRDISEKDGNSPLSKIKFGKELMRYCGPRTKPDSRLAFGNRDAMWPNVFVKGMNDPKPQEQVVKWED